MAAKDTYLAAVDPNGVNGTSEFIDTIHRPDQSTIGGAQGGYYGASEEQGNRVSRRSLATRATLTTSGAPTRTSPLGRQA